MLITFHRNHYLSYIELVRKWCGAVGLRLIPIRILRRIWREVDVVGRRIAVRDADILLSHDSEDVWLVMTTVLIQRGWRAGRIEAPITNLRVI